MPSMLDGTLDCMPSMLLGMLDAALSMRRMLDGMPSMPSMLDGTLDGMPSMLDGMPGMLDAGERRRPCGNRHALSMTHDEHARYLEIK